MLWRLCANWSDSATGRMAYTAMLDRHTIFPCNVTITHLAQDAFCIPTGSGQATRDASWIGPRIAAREFAAQVDFGCETIAATPHLRLR